ncbi:alpha/beta hydrolase [Prolixibacteraceae bacterium JC049]|nr:alpha/beta hydrolase [Prolixibacteraceae bacterium JC049]
MKRVRLLIIGLIFTYSVKSQDLVIDVKYANTPEDNEIAKQEQVLENNSVVNVSKAQLYVWLPKQDYTNAPAMIICPGGGYSSESMKSEGHDFAQWLNERGIVGIVLKYRLPNQHPMVPLEDIKNAMRQVRETAKEWKVNPNKIGVAGFSAGGHLASSLATHFDFGKRNSTNDFEKISCRPDFALLVYPVISMKVGITHQGSRNQLIGESGEASMINYFSNELHVKRRTPPTFLVHADNDRSVTPENSILFYQQLKRRMIPAELHIFRSGGHGFGMKKLNKPIDKWPDLFMDWLKAINIVRE